MGRAADRMIRALLRLFPEEFRADYGGEMTTVFRDQYARTTGWSRLRLWSETLADLSAGAFEEHRRMTLQDIRISMRRQLAQPGFTMVAIASLALGIGANTAIFSVTHATMLAPLPFRDPDRVVMIMSRQEGTASRGTVTSADFLDWRSRSASFAQMEMMTHPNRVTVSSGGGSPERLGMQNVTPGYFPMLGIQPRMGRYFNHEEALGDDPTVALISESYWQRRFGGDPNVLQQQISVGGRPRVIVGVVPVTYQAGQLSYQADVWLPIDLAPASTWVQRRIRWMLAAARLKDGISLESAQAEMTGIAAQLAKEYPDTNRKWTVLVEPMRDTLGSFFRVMLLPLIAAVGFVLLIACANVANLLLARAVSRRRELAVRSALGASRSRLIRELLADGFALAIPGALLGLAVAWMGMRLFLVIAGEFAYSEQLRFNVPVVAFCAGAAVLTALLAGLLPAWQASRASITEGLKEGGKGSAGGQRTYLRNLLVVVEMALAVMLLVGAGLMLNTVMRLQSAALGFDPRQVVTLRLDMAGDRYSPTAPKRDIDMRYVEPAVNQFYEQLVSEVRGQGWAEETALAAALPMSPSGAGGGPFEISGKADQQRRNAQFNCVTAGYFSLLRIPVVRGRAIGDQDHAGAPWVAVVNEAFARAHFPNEDPIGKHIAILTTEQEQPRQIVGIVADHKRYTPKVPPAPEIYMSFAQQTRLIVGNHQGLRLRPMLAVRTNLGPRAVEEAVRKVAERLDASIPVHDVKRLTDYVEERSGQERFYLRLLGIFAGLAVVLAAVGVFGLMHHAVADRLHEIGIRMALGAGKGSVMRMILRQGVTLAGVGLALGIAGASAGTVLIERFLYGVQRTDLATLAGVCLLMMAVAVAACYVPARRAMAVDPMVALRRD
jgi:predicted permease